MAVCLFITALACSPEPDVELPRPGVWEVVEFEYTESTCAPRLTSFIGIAYVGHQLGGLVMTWGAFGWNGYAVSCPHDVERRFDCPLVVREATEGNETAYRTSFHLSGSWADEDLSLVEAKRSSCTGVGCNPCSWTETAILEWVAEDFDEYVPPE
jgi:hypothetical protein